MTREKPELFTDIRDFTTLFYVILNGYRRLSRVTGKRFAIWSLALAIRDFALYYLNTVFIVRRVH